MTVTNELLDKIDKLEAAATPGPWETSEDLDIGASNYQIPVTYEDGSEVVEGYTLPMRVVSLPYGQPDTWPRHNAALICTLRNNARALTGEIRTLRAEVARLKERLEQVSTKDQWDALRTIAHWAQLYAKERPNTADELIHLHDLATSGMPTEKDKP